MASHGIRDKVAIIGMGCTNFGEHWDKSADDMLIESSSAALKDAGVTHVMVHVAAFHKDHQAVLPVLEKRADFELLAPSVRQLAAEFEYRLDGFLGADLTGGEHLQHLHAVVVHGLSPSVCLR